MQTMTVEVWDNIFEVEYFIEGTYYAGSRYEPPEYPELYVTNIIPVETNDEYSEAWLESPIFNEAIETQLWKQIEEEKNEYDGDDSYDDYSYDYDQDCDYWNRLE